MKFIDFDTDGRLFESDKHKPIPGAQEVLVKVASFGVNRADLLQVAGKYPPPKGASEVLGMEISGVVDAVGEDVTTVNVGQSICAMITGGGYAQYAVVPSAHVIPMPENMSFTNAAAIPEVFLTATQALHQIADVTSADRLLIHAGASGLGSALIQLAKLHNVHVAVTASSESKLNYCRNLGADITINYSADSFKEQLRVMRFFPDIIVDIVAGNYLNDNLSLLASDGVIVQLAMLQGRYVERLDMAKLLAKRASIKGSTLRNRSDDYKTELVKDFVNYYWHRFQAGELQACVDAIFPISDITKAHEHMRLNRNKGKLVISTKDW